MPVPATLPNLYTSPNLVFDWLGTEGVDLRLDDHNRATPQKVVATADAAPGATSLSVAALAYPLLRGTTLRFDGGGMSDVVSVVLTATAVVGGLTLPVEALAGAVNAQAAALDTGVNVALANRLLAGCRYGTTQVKLYCCGRYDDDQLVLSYQAQQWATILAARWVCRRRGNTAPESIERDAEEAVHQLEMVNRGEVQVPEVGTRTACHPFLTNVTVDVRYDVAKVRVEPQISEGTPTQYPQYVDWSSIFFLEW